MRDDHYRDALNEAIDLVECEDQENGLFAKTVSEAIEQVTNHYQLTGPERRRLEQEPALVELDRAAHEQGPPLL